MITKAESTELLANFTCGKCRALNLSEPIKVEAFYVEYERVEINVTAECPKCGEENLLEEQS